MSSRPPSDRDRSDLGFSSYENEDIIDKAGDLDYTNSRLRLRHDDLMAEFERNRELIENLSDGGAEITGRGWAADEAVVVIVDGSHRLVDLELDPRALRLGSIDNLRKAIMTAYDHAVDDIANQLKDLNQDVLSQTPIRDMMDAMPELTALLPDGAYTAFLEDEPKPKSAKKPDRDRDSRQSSSSWEDRNPYV